MELQEQRRCTKSRPTKQLTSRNKSHVPVLISICLKFDNFRRQLLTFLHQAAILCFDVGGNGVRHGAMKASIAGEGVDNEQIDVQLCIERITSHPFNT